MKKLMKKFLQVLLPVALILNLFGEGDMVNTTEGYRNTNTGSTQAFDSSYTLEPGLKTYYDTELLENTREKRVFAQFGMRQPLPKNNGKTVEWRKWKTLPPALKALVEGVNPKGRKLGEIAITKTIGQHGDYVEKTDVLDLHFYDNVGQAITEELGSAASQTMDLLIRNELLTGTNVLVADTVASNGTVTENTVRWKLSGVAYRTPDMVAQIATKMEADKVPMQDGRYYIGVIHPYAKYDLRKAEYWTEVHEYAAVEEIFNGEIGELHGIRFMTTTNAPIFAPKPLFTDAQRYLTVASYSGSASDTSATAGVATAYCITVDETLTEDIGKALVGRCMLLEQSAANKELLEIAGVSYASKKIYLMKAPTNTPADGNYLNPGEGGDELHSTGKQVAVFASLFFGKDAFGIIDPDGAGLEFIYHDKRVAGGPLELKSTAGYKFEFAAKILYEERLLRLEHLSKYSGTAQDVLDTYEDGFEEQYA